MPNVSKQNVSKQNVSKQNEKRSNKLDIYIKKRKNKKNIEKYISKNHQGT